MLRHRSSVVCAIVFFALLLQPLRAADPAFERGVEFIRNEQLIAITGIRALSVAAHPDDEDGAALNYLRRVGCETHICFCTRGEGGQNEAGPETGVQLAAMRTREIEEACAILGAKPWFLNLPDFGFSKSVEETMKVWNHDVALERMVRVIRRIRPHIVITNHNPDGTDHGHHRTAGKLLVEAFDAAADAKQFPQQIEEGLQPWTIERIFLRVISPEGAALSMEVSRRDEFSGTSASEIGAYALSRHFSQGMLRDLKVGEREMRYFSILKQRTPADAKVAAFLENSFAKASATSDFNQSFAALISTHALVKTLAAASGEAKTDAHARLHLNRALAEALGLKLEVRCEDEFITGGEQAKLSVRAANTGAFPVTLVKLSFKAESKKWILNEAKSGKELKGGDSETADLEIGAMLDAPLTYPLEDHLFEHDESSAPVAAVAEFLLSIGDVKNLSVTVEAPVPLGLAAPFTFTVSPSPLIFFGDPALANEDQDVAHFKLLARCNKKIKEPVFLSAAIGEKPKAGENGAVLPLNFKGDTAIWTFNKWLDVGKTNAGADVKTFVWDLNGFYSTPSISIHRVPLDMPPNMRIALVKGVDVQTWLALKRMQDGGVARGTFSVETPSDEELLTTNLNKYQAIALDIRTTQQRPEIRKLKERLKAFMAEGGTVVCMYQKDFDWNERAANPRGVGFFRGVGGGGEIAPFPIELSFDRVTREDAPVTMLNPTHPLLLKPCRIWEKDFEGWVQERGAYFPKKWAPDYTPLLSSHDPGEKALDGGLLVADVDRGAFIYCSYFLHHQFRAGVPGAYRLMANMLSYSRMKRMQNP